jgi:mono/diheme cytochrome c family protein
VSNPKEGSDRIDYQETPDDITEVHAAVEREKPEPSADVTPMPIWLTGLCAAATVWAGIYFGIFNGGLSGNVYNEYESSPAVLFPLPPKAGKGGAAAAQAQTLAQQGKSVYTQNCLACHGPAGAGMPGMAPALAKSEYVTGSEKRLVGVILKGLKGPITVHNETKPYSGNMVAWEATLSPKKIAAVSSYIRSEWGNTAPEISEAKVIAAKKEFEARKDQWTEAELFQIPADATLPDEGGAAAPAAPAPAGAPGAPAPATPGVAAVPAPAAPAAPGAAPAPATPGAHAPVALAKASPEQIDAGKTLYMGICVACHMPNGAGLPGAFPPLTKSHYVNGSIERFAAIILKGNNPPFVIDGKTYVVPMPPQEAALDDTKIASIMTFVRNSFENSGGLVTPEMVAAARKKFAEHKTPWTQAELDAWKD